MIKGPKQESCIINCIFLSRWQKPGTTERGWLDVHWLGSTLRTILGNGSSALLPSLLPSAGLQLYAYR